MRYEILDSLNGNVINTIDADESFCSANYPFYRAVNQPSFSVSDPCEWLIDIGPFFDRFGAYKMAVLTSQDVVVKAIVQDVTVRKWVDLQRVDVAQALDLLISKSLLDEATKTAILTNPVTFEDNRALRKMYF